MAEVIHVRCWGQSREGRRHDAELRALYWQLKQRHRPGVANDRIAELFRQSGLSAAAFYSVVGSRPPSVTA